MIQAAYAGPGSRVTVAELVAHLAPHVKPETAVRRFGQIVWRPGRLGTETAGEWLQQYQAKYGHDRAVTQGLRVILQLVLTQLHRHGIIQRPDGRRRRRQSRDIVFLRAPVLSAAGRVASITGPDVFRSGLLHRGLYRILCEAGPEGLAVPELTARCLAAKVLRREQGERRYRRALASGKLKGDAGIERALRWVVADAARWLVEKGRARHLRFGVYAAIPPETG